MTNSVPEVVEGQRYSETEVAKKLGVDRTSVDRWMNEGQMEYERRQRDNKRYVTGREIIRVWMITW